MHPSQAFHPPLPPRLPALSNLHVPPLKCTISPLPPLAFPLPPLHLGSLTISPPIILAPMAGVTNYPFRKLCRSYGAALYISEMVLASSILSSRTEGRLKFGPADEIRSAQLYSTDAGEAAAAAELLIVRDGVRHIDLNFGCPARKVLKKGGGAALAANESKLREIVSKVVEVGRRYNVAVTAKMRAGLSAGELTYERAGFVMEECGIAAVALHTRTAEEMYERGAGRRGWGRLKRLREIVNIPVIGNGDVFTVGDAVDMVRETGVEGVMIGRGCLGRPWLFGDLKQGFEDGNGGVCVPPFEEVRKIMMKHVEEAVEWEGDGGVRGMRKWFGWYWKGYTGLPEGWVKKMCRTVSIEELREVVGEFDGVSVGYDMAQVVGERGKVGRVGKQ